MANAAQAKAFASQKVTYVGGQTGTDAHALRSATYVPVVVWTTFYGLSSLAATVAGGMIMFGAT